MAFVDVSTEISFWQTGMNQENSPLYSSKWRFNTTGASKFSEKW